MTPEEFLADSALGRAVFTTVASIVSNLGGAELRASKSQISFRRRRGFAYLWLPGMYLLRPDAEVVLSIALDRKLTSPRFKEIAHPARHIWQHHLEISDPADLDGEVREWLKVAYDSAG